MYSPFQTEHPNMFKMTQNQSQSKLARHNFHVRCWEASDSSSFFGSSQKEILLNWIIIIGLRQLPKLTTTFKKWSTWQHNDKDSTFIPHEDTDSWQLVDYWVIRYCPWDDCWMSVPKFTSQVRIRPITTHHIKLKQCCKRNTTMKTISHEMVWHDSCADLLTSLDTTECPY
jgi:hypothetical protein